MPTKTLKEQLEDNGIKGRRLDFIMDIVDNFFHPDDNVGSIKTVSLLLCGEKRTIMYVCFGYVPLELIRLHKNSYRIHATLMGVKVRGGKTPKSNIMLACACFEKEGN